MADTLDTYLTGYVSNNVPQRLMRLKGIPSNLELEIESGDYSEVADENILKIVLQELQGNAYKSVWGDQFPYTVHSQDRQAEFRLKTGEFKFRLYHDGDNEIIAFSDNGCGIPENNYECIFWGGFSTFRTMGMGLNLMSAHLKRLGAELSFESEVGKGTTFYITFLNKQK